MSWRILRGLRPYRMAIGKSAYPTVAATVGNPAWLTMSPEERQDAINGAMRSVRSDARAGLGFDWHKRGDDAALPPGYQMLRPEFLIGRAAKPRATTRMFGARQ